MGDVRHPGTLATATSGVATVVSAIHGFAATDGGSPARVDRDGNAALADAAAAGGCAHRAAVGSRGFAGSSARAVPDEGGRRAARAHARARVDDPAVRLVRRDAARPAVPHSRRRAVPRGPRAGPEPGQRRLVTDVAAVAVAASHGEFTGRVVDVGGPEDLTLDQLAAAAQRRLGCTGPIRHVPLGCCAPWRPRRASAYPLGQVAALAVAVDTMPMTYDALHDEGALPWRGTRVSPTCAQPPAYADDGPSRDQPVALSETSWFRCSHAHTVSLVPLAGGLIIHESPRGTARGAATATRQRAGPHRPGRPAP